MSDIPNETNHPRCRNLMCKSMAVYGEDFENDPEYQGGMTDFWCILTSKNYGPDSADVNLPQCSNPERPCYRAF